QRCKGHGGCGERKNGLEADAAGGEVKVREVSKSVVGESDGSKWSNKSYKSLQSHRPLTAFKLTHMTYLTTLTHLTSMT
ncbi:MAG TPA: hypothetical protein VF476_14575, partial [Chitinophagaceae bacterium]